MNFYLSSKIGTTESYAEAETALAQALSKYPNLTPAGLGGGPDGGPGGDRADFDLQAISDAIRFLRECRPTSKPTVSSYYAKHVAEAQVGAYISNGCLIAAVVHLGIGIAPINGTPNVLLAVNMARRTTTDVLALLAKRWPKCFSVYERRRRPLKVGIRSDILATELMSVITETELGLVLAAYTGNRWYQQGLREGAERIGLDGSPSGVVTPEQAVRAEPKATRGSFSPTPSPKPPPAPAPRGDGLAALRAAAAARRARGGAA